MDNQLMINIKTDKIFLAVFSSQYQSHRHSGKFCVSDFQQNQKYHIINMQNGDLIPLISGIDFLEILTFAQNLYLEVILLQFNPSLLRIHVVIRYYDDFVAQMV